MKKVLSSKLVKNIISLIILQGSNYIFPLITFPYLVRTLGVENYGVLIFSVALMQFLNIFIDYGFNISGTRDISINKKSMTKVNDIYNVIMTIKIILTLIVGFFYIIVIVLFSENTTIYLISYLIIIGNTLFPIWLFQGLEEMKYITYINVIVKIIVTLLIIISIKDGNDLNLAVLFQTFYYLIPGIISIFFVKSKFNIRFKLILDKFKLVNELKRGKHIFMTNLWIKFYNQGPAVILGLISSKTATGNFGIGQKIQGAFSGLSLPFTQAIYPHLCDLNKTNLIVFHKFKNKLLRYSFILSFIISLALIVFANQIINFVTGSLDDTLVILVRLFSIIIFLGIMNTIFSRIMYAMDLQRILNKSYSIAAISFIVFSIPLTKLFHEFGMVVTIILSEGIVFLLNINNLKRKSKTYIKE